METRRRARVQTSEALRAGLVLAVTGGYLDAYTYLCRGHVFANAETGNMVLLGINLVTGQWSAAVKYIPPIFAFFAGVLVAEWMRGRGKARPERGRLHWRQRVLLLELAVLLAAALAPLGGGWDMAVNVGVSFVCALQVESFRRVHGQAYATTMCTGNLRSGTEALYHGAVNHDPALLRRSGCYFGVILCFLLGAALGCRMAPLFPQQAVLAAALFQLAAFALMCAVDAA